MRGHAHAKALPATVSTPLAAPVIAAHRPPGTPAGPGVEVSGGRASRQLLALHASRRLTEAP
jgi:hypothetical protein